VLNLDSNQIGEAGAASLAQSLSRGAFPQLRHLHLRNNRLKAGGVAALAGALESCPCLQVKPRGGAGRMALALACDRCCWRPVGRCR
jgi:hypothetical protein